MTVDTRKEIVLHGMRWANTILVEILSNHAIRCSIDGRKHLSSAIEELRKAESEFSNVK